MADWLTWEIKEEYEEDRIIGRMISILREFRNVEHKLIKLHRIGGAHAEIRVRTEEQTVALEEKEKEWLRQLASNLRLLMMKIGHDEQFDKQFIKTRAPRVKY